jgi:hypothetical protein
MMLGTTLGSILRHALAALGLALGASSLALAQVAAEVRSASGVVFAQPQGGQVRVIQTGAKLSVGDTVGTEKGAFALIVFNDGSRVALRPESAIAIRGFSFQPEDPSKDQMSVQLLKGWLRNVSGQIGKRGNQNAFDLKVNDTTIGIRGTDFGVRLCDQECAGQAQACCRSPAGWGSCCPATSPCSACAKASPRRTCRPAARCSWAMWWPAATPRPCSAWTTAPAWCWARPRAWHCAPRKTNGAGVPCG